MSCPVEIGPRVATVLADGLNQQRPVAHVLADGGTPRSTGIESLFQAVAALPTASSSGMRCSTMAPAEFQPTDSQHRGLGSADGRSGVLRDRSPSGSGRRFGWRSGIRVQGDLHVTLQGYRCRRLGIAHQLRSGGVAASTAARRGCRADDIGRWRGPPISAHSQILEGLCARCGIAAD
jgi:hypothetical protein